MLLIDAWLDRDGRFLGARAPLPLDVPFTTAQARAWIGRRGFAHVVRTGLVRRLLTGVYVAAQAPDDIVTRARALALVIPDTAVVTDRTAAWLHGVDILPRSALLTPPPVSVMHVDDTRVRRAGVDGRRRGLLPNDITEVEGVRVTTALRTASDLGRLLWRFDALAALDGFLALGVPHDLLGAEIDRYRGMRGVRQLRALVPIADRRAESPGESALRLWWYDAGLPRPELQWWVYDDDGTPLYRLDLADPDVRYAAEYDGVEFHSSKDQAQHDEGRREWIASRRHWSIDPFTKADVYDRGAWPVGRLMAGYADARRTSARWSASRPTTDR